MDRSTIISATGGRESILCALHTASCHHGHALVSTTSEAASSVRKRGCSGQVGSLSAIEYAVPVSYHMPIASSTSSQGTASRCFELCNTTENYINLPTVNSGRPYACDYTAPRSPCPTLKPSFPITYQVSTCSLLSCSLFDQEA